MTHVSSDVGPFAIVPEWVADAVSPQALALFVRLALHADRETDQAWPSRSRLAKLLEVSTKSVDRWLMELVDIGVVEKTPRRDETGWHSSLYLVRYVSPGRAVGVANPSPKDVPQNQNQLEPEPRTREELDRRSSFDAFWNAYPLKVGKPKARTAFDRAARRAAVAEIIAGAERYRDDPNREDVFTAHPTTWLNRDGWDDPPLPGRNGDLRAAAERLMG